MLWNRGRHNITFGGDFRAAAIQLPVATGPARHVHLHRAAAAGGATFADFLLGVPDTSSIAFGNADKYFRESVYDAYSPTIGESARQLTLNAGMRWEYGAPITELYGRLVNLDIAPGFAAVAPVVASQSRRAADRPEISRFAPPARQARLRAARRDRLASDLRLVAGGSRRVRHLLRHLGLPDHRPANGAASRRCRRA